ncbi:hypothetical protein DQ238_15790 [Geodermatophilus sp. TF02-6]|uniref:hypothetical protein n=1 Tax=Geodermatophilus sp. TF02-6 TaxID=2250575 RepID=UPI000DEAB614|nr:hypothetical protein [Geodermatophilus sp. TF02-6]RBY77148.1 hypothetical protein DQ238_15790 [Geodermatophilus sp. TF02-6]
MSATARAAGLPPEDRPARTPLAAVHPAPRAPEVRPDETRPGGAHTAPVRTGSLRSRPTRATGPVARASAASAVRGRGVAGARRAPFVLLVVALLVATTLGLLFLNTAIAVDSLKATQLAAANEDRTQEVQRLEQQVIAGDTPASLAATAAAAGLVPAGAAAYLVIGDDGSVTLRGRPVPAPAAAPRPRSGG